MSYDVSFKAKLEGTVESTAEFLRQIADNCDKFPTAVIEVDC